MDKITKEEDDGYTSNNTANNTANNTRRSDVTTMTDKPGSCDCGEELLSPDKGSSGHSGQPHQDTDRKSVV
jgi:hypothetical protein